MIPEEIKDVCRSCESNIFAQNKGCTFRSLGNEYCDYVENATRLYLKLQQENEQLKKQKEGFEKILIEISDQCKVCYLHENCIEESCPLFRIEKIIHDILKGGEIK